MAHTCDRQLKLNDCYEFEASLGYIVSSSAAWATERDTISTKTKQIKGVQKAEGFSNQRDTGVRGVQEPGRKEEEQRESCLWTHQTPLALKMEEGQPAEDRGLWKPQKARKWILACSIQNKGSLRRHIRGLLSTL